MSDPVAVVDLETGIPDAAIGGAASSCLRMVGYCAGCGTWDEHGPTCVTCGYDFSGDEPTLSSV